MQFLVVNLMFGRLGKFCACNPFYTLRFRLANHFMSIILFLWPFCPLAIKLNHASEWPIGIWCCNIHSQRINLSVYLIPGNTQKAPYSWMLRSMFLKNLTVSVWLIYILHHFMYPIYPACIVQIEEDFRLKMLSDCSVSGIFWWK